MQPVLLVIHTAGTSQHVTHPWDNGVSGLLNDPLSTLDAVRNRNAGDYRRWLYGYATAAGPHVHVVDWTLPDEASNPYPLGWLLSMSTQERIAAQVSASMIGPSAKQIEAATGWSVRPCDDKEPSLRLSCQEARARGAN